MVADENGGALDNRVVFFGDEVGTIPKIESVEIMFSASRSRRVSIVPASFHCASRATQGFLRSTVTGGIKKQVTAFAMTC